MWGWCTGENSRNTTAVPAADTSSYPAFTPRAYRARIVYRGSEKASKEFLCGEVIGLAALGADVVGGFEVRGWYLGGNHSVEVEGEAFSPCLGVMSGSLPMLCPTV